MGLNPWWIKSAHTKDNMNFTEKQNIRAIENLKQLPDSVQYPLMALMFCLASLMIYFFIKWKRIKKFYSWVYGGNLKAKDKTAMKKNPDDYYDEKYLKRFRKHPFPTLSVRILSELSIFLAFIFLAFAITLLIGKPLGLM